MTALIRLAVPVHNARLQALADQVDAAGEGATLTVYDGTIPATPADGVGLSSALVEFPVPHPLADDITNGVLTGNPFPETMATEAGVASWCRVRDATGAARLDMSVGVEGSGHPVTLPSTQVYAGMLVRGVSIVFTDS